MNMRFASAVLAAAAISSGVSRSDALAQQVASKDPRAVRAGTYNVEPDHTQVLFSLSHLGFTDYMGFVSGASGTLTLDPAKLNVGKLDVTLAIQSIQTTAPSLDERLRGDQWFDVAKFPTATFISTKVTRTGSNTAIIQGDLTLHGVTKPVILQVRLVGAGTNPMDKIYNVGFEANGVIKRSEFGIGQYFPLVGDDVTLKIAAEFVLLQ